MGKGVITKQIKSVVEVSSLCVSVQHDYEERKSESHFYKPLTLLRIGTVEEDGVKKPLR